MMTVAEALTLMMSFASLIVAVIAVSKEKAPTLLGLGKGGLLLPASGPLHFLQPACVLVRPLAVANVLFLSYAFPFLL
ncbi:putative holin-like toxin [Geobacillus thermocatenulatus]|uniref:putative holin-like toxin n=1 Tax=Geobacillus thermocatenulatus TaxID=33938 RepID=UPI000473E68A|nr:putative holin-like toxin [Geobacillus thermocatenulatus]